MGELIGKYKTGEILVSIYSNGTYHSSNWDEDAQGKWKIVNGKLHFKTYSDKEWQIGHRRDGIMVFLNIVNNYVEKQLFGDNNES